MNLLDEYTRLTGRGAGWYVSNSLVSVPAFTNAATLYEKAIVIPIPARAASQAESKLPTTNLDCTGTACSLWSRVKVQDFGEINGA
jgi:hypothetical protein